MVDKLRNILKNNKELFNYFEAYLSEEILDKWTSLYKISQYAEHSSNYIESLFGRITNKNIAKQSKVLNFIKVINDIIENIIADHKEMKLGKMENSLMIYKRAYDIYLLKDIYHLKNNKYKINGTKEGTVHFIDMDDWSCTCLSFNQNGYTCKHMFLILIEVSINEYKLNFKNMKNINIFEFIKNGRKIFVKDEKFKKLIDENEFPVTIGVNSFHLKYSKFY